MDISVNLWAAVVILAVMAVCLCLGFFLGWLYGFRQEVRHRQEEARLHSQFVGLEKFADSLKKKWSRAKKCLLPKGSLGPSTSACGHAR